MSSRDPQRDSRESDIRRDPLINITSAIYDLIRTNSNSVNEIDKHLVTMIHQFESVIVLLNMLHKNTSHTNLKLDELNIKIDQLNSRINKMEQEINRIGDNTNAAAGSLETLIVLEKNE
jgi:uncharacterized coiled-coil DUF342 family protein